MASTDQNIPGPTRRALTLAVLLAAALVCTAAHCLAQGEEPDAQGPRPAPQVEQERKNTQRPIQTALKEIQGLLAERLKTQEPDALQNPVVAAGLLKREKADLLLRRYLASEYRDEVVLRELNDGIRLLKRAKETGKNPLEDARGLVEWAYLSPSDNSPQPYLMYVPEGYDASRPRGLFVFLHGYAYDLNKYNWIEMMFPQDEAATITRDADCLLMMPFARGNTDFQALGEDDVMFTIREVRKHYRIDPNRIILCGISMGGMGAWTIAAHYPDVFAAVVPISARGDYFLWHTDIARKSLPAWKLKQIGMEFGFDLRRNLQIPSLVICGTDDMLVKPAQSRLMASKLKEEHYPTRLLEIGEADHYSWSAFLTNKPLLELAKTARRSPHPTTIHYRTYTLKFNRAWWLSIEGIDQWWRPADVTAAFDAKDRSVRIESTNVTKLRLELPKGLCGDLKAVTVHWNQQTSKHAIAQFPATIVLQNGYPTDAKLLKTPRLCGPIREAFAGPFVIVHGRAPAGGLPDDALTVAKRWLLYSQGVPAVLGDDKITENVIKSNNLILVGTPETNKMIARVADGLPVKFMTEEKNGRRETFYVIGRHRYAAARHGLAMLYPNPLNPERCVVVMSGVCWGSAVAQNHFFDLLPDYIVFTDEKAEDGTDSQETVCAGYFDTKWQLDERTMWTSRKGGQ